MFVLGISYFTILFGVPCSLIIRIVIRRKDRLGYILQGALHIIAGFAIVLVTNADKLSDGDWTDWIELIGDGGTLLIAAQAGVFYAVYFLMRHSLHMDDPMWGKEREVQ
ncbi:hypothetical protein [Paenibacillus kobensis]|uniref:hypothetical protein n=1 Tax=Paenibacillus kobensis TaxID=59841 RepID=UPI000FDC8583|nr:hypothetical protein [Paenibacillus kobensis]